MTFIKKMSTNFWIQLGNGTVYFFDTEEVNISERIAYYMFKAFLLKAEITSVFYKVNDSWCVYDYTNRLDKINAIYKRFREGGLPEDLEKLEACEMPHDPLAVYKECHTCGKPTEHYNGACHKWCDDVLYNRYYECRKGPDCILCRYIIK